jgi:hypothetical protein
MPRPVQQSPERAALAAAHQELAARQAALAQAEDVQSKALTAWGEADRADDGSERPVTDVLEQRLAGLLARREPGHNVLRHQYAAEVDAARTALHAAEQQLEPFKSAYAAAKSAISEAECALTDAQARITTAARSVAATEAIPVAREHMARCREALATLLEHAPHLLVMVDKDLLPPELTHEITTTAGSLLSRARAWPEFEGRHHTSPWRIAKEMLQQDPQAALPSVTS